MDRRHFLKTTTAVAALQPLDGLLAADANSPKATLKLSACDWSLDARHDLAAFDHARSIGLDGVEVSFGEPGVQNDLRDPSVRDAYLAKSAETGVSISSLAMGVLNQIPFASDPRTEQWVAACIGVMPKLKVKTALLAFFGKGDIKDKPELQDQVIARLKRLAPKAEDAGVVLGIESWLDADTHIRIVDAIDSPAVKVYYDVANMEKSGYDIYTEIPKLGLDRICQVHTKENGFLLGKGKVDFRRIGKALDQIGYSGWLVIESARPKGSDLIEAYTHNATYLRSIFPASKS